MRSSNYNYIIPEQDGYLFFNGITGASFKVQSKNKDAFVSIIDNPDLNYSKFGNFIDRMLNQGFIVSDDTDENELIRKKYELNRCPGLYEVMILPTYQCNLRCWYCTQEHANQWLSDESVVKIKKRIEYILRREDVNQFHLTWFGGEPLLSYDRILEISQWAKDFCEALNKSFFSSITTNGTLLNKERIDKLKELGFGHYQITIDGDRLTHNKIKVLGSNSAFDVTISNIAELAKHTQCTLRFNYTKDNLKPHEIIEDLKNRIPEEVRGNITIALYKVWQESGENVNPEDVKLLAKLARDSKFKAHLQSTGMCYADYKYFDCIFPNGKVGKCDNADPESEHVCGIISDDGEVTWENEDCNSLPGIFDPKIDAAECVECRYLPVCWGPCPKRREEMMDKYGKVTCMYNGNKDAEIQKLLVNRYLNLTNY
ncbi:MAG: radical SAM protein [Bacteroidales bacterium]|nr:radical SAM protein [Bacteroidales bacterium]